MTHIELEEALKKLINSSRIISMAYTNPNDPISIVGDCVAADITFGNKKYLVYLEEDLAS